jgi:hypothetical protein
VNLRPERLADADRGAGAVVAMTRPSGYFGVPRDRIVLDGTTPPAGIPPGVAGLSETRLRIADARPRPIIGEFNDEWVTGRTWPAAGNHLTLLELTS